MIDTKELRLDAKDANGWLMPMEISGTDLIELIDRLEAAEQDIALKERIIDSLGAELSDVANERDELRADFEAAHAQMMTSVAAEREACAKACERLTKPSGPVPGHPIDAWLLATIDCAEVIRARSALEESK